MPAPWTDPAGIHRRYGDQPASVPRQFVFQLTSELSPALIEDGSIQAGFGAHVRARTFKIARRRARHVVYLKVLDTHDRVVFADHGRGLVQIIPASVGDADVDTNDSRLRLLPVPAELLLSTHGLLRPAERGLVLTEAVQRFIEGIIGEGREADDSHVDAHSG